MGAPARDVLVADLSKVLHHLEKGAVFAARLCFKLGAWTFHLLVTGTESLCYFSLTCLGQERGSSLLNRRQ